MYTGSIVVLNHAPLPVISQIQLRASPLNSLTGNPVALSTGVEGILTHY